MLLILDIAGQDEYSVMRHQFFASSEAFLMGFNVCDKTSFSNCSKTFNPFLCLSIDLTNVASYLVATNWTSKRQDHSGDSCHPGWQSNRPDSREAGKNRRRICICSATWNTLHWDILQNKMECGWSIWIIGRRMA